MPQRLLLGLIGSNILGSLSPALHEDALAAAGIAGHYHLMDLMAPADRTLPGLLQAVKTIGFAGINVTFPCKESIIPLLDAVSSQARQIGAVNTVTFDQAGRTTGHNTDRAGFSRSFEETLGRQSSSGKTAVLIGAGGAGRAVAFALMDLGIAQIMIHDTNEARAAALVSDIVADFGPRATLLDIPDQGIARADGLVNATPVGMQGIPGQPVALTSVGAHHWVADVIYTPLETELIRAAQSKGARVMTGGGMCVHQAAEAFRLFTGEAPDVARMHRVFAAAVAARD